MKTKPLTYGDLPNQIGPDATHKGAFLYCDVCGSEYSANRGDYFSVPDSAAATCANGHRVQGLRLVRKETRYIDASVVR